MVSSILSSLGSAALHSIGYHSVPNKPSLPPGHPRPTSQSLPLYHPPIRNQIHVENGKDNRVLNLFNILGYIPCVSTVGASLRGVYAMRYDGVTPLTGCQLIRGAVEFCGWGVVFLAPDLLVTVLRAGEQMQSTALTQ